LPSQVASGTSPETSARVSFMRAVTVSSLAAGLGPVIAVPTNARLMPAASASRFASVVRPSAVAAVRTSPSRASLRWRKLMPAPAA
jgi:hypothetical protein